MELFDQISRDTGLIHFRRRMLKELKIDAPRLPKHPGTGHMTPGIYVLSSGMMVENTPSYVAAASLLGTAANSVYFVGYCDPDTPGGKLRKTKRGDPFLFETMEFETRVNAEVEWFDLSGHADREELLDLIAEFEPKDVILTHGDPLARDWFSAKIKDEKLAQRVIDPEPCLTYDC
jgi:Cft2 family RNA processing exonuclease